MSKQETKEKPEGVVKDDDDKVWLELDEVENFVLHVTSSLHSLAANITGSIQQVRENIEKMENSENKGETKDGKE